MVACRSLPNDHRKWFSFLVTSVVVPFAIAIPVVLWSIVQHFTRHVVELENDSDVRHYSFGSRFSFHASRFVSDQTWTGQILVSFSSDFLHVRSPSAEIAWSTHECMKYAKSYERPESHLTHLRLENPGSCVTESREKTMNDLVNEWPFRSRCMCVSSRQPLKENHPASTTKCCFTATDWK